MAPDKPILLVEMCRDGTPSAWSILSELGMAARIVRLPSVQNVLEQLEKGGVERPAVMFLDGFEPNAQGLEFLRKLKESERFKSIPVIALAAAATDPAAIDECYRIGIAGYIPKSEDRNELINAVRAVHEYWSLSELPACT